MRKILITGANGLLGQKIVNQLESKGQDYIATGRGENRNPNCPPEKYHSLDITLEDEVESSFQKLQPTHVINTAAMTNVDACEDDVEGCELLNVKAVEILWKAAKKIGAHLQLLSTDFVFDGKQGNYKETDEPNPLSVYGQSKLDAEHILTQDENTNWSIVRTIIILGKTPGMSRSNILLWAKGALEKGDALTIVDDQFRAPTWADDLAWACLRIVELDKKGIYHICGPETLSILEIVHRVGKYYDLNTQLIQPIKSSSLNQKAKRPPKTGFDLSKAKNELGYNPKTLEQILERL
ncbi:dTDP-4-dehydrorhamnose reductase [Lishizhenia tianjinensis]|uniref:dTDP-4-dehydrorhamnose reductase n=1 Tax=Lishizhenia tianjinensis TaxID=477690 RepID=A0A1I7BLU4_9FLAO|nr:SDR family oxidoreductase [Lishizhenia tianjinensis]SFT88150.1 dTDP-4-dehydrorhamnose reductase [Lishizhenia tianjinensis]